MVVEVVEGTSDVDRELAVGSSEVVPESSAGTARVGSAEDRLAEAVVELEQFKVARSDCR